MTAPLSDRLTRLSYTQARRVLLITGLTVLGLVALVSFVRGVDTVEVVATLLFLPIFLAFVYGGMRGGVAAAVVATGIYAALRTPAIEAIGIGEFTGLLAARAAAYLIFGALGGWSTQVLEGSLDKLALYDEIDDETGLHNARYLLHQTDLEMARALRYQTLFSVVALDVPVTSFQSLSTRQRRAVLRDLGRQLAEGVRAVDHVVHASDHRLHRLVAILPETGPEGAEVFRERFDERVRLFFTARGVTLDSAGAARAIVFPGGEAEMEELRVAFRQLDADQHR